jgi:hypothetical protein
VIWAHGLGGPSEESALGLSLDRNGHVYTVGSFSGTVDFDPEVGSANLASYGESDAYISVLDSDGHYVWAGQLGGAGSDAAGKISISPDGFVDVSGSFTKSGDFDPGPGNVLLNPVGYGDAFLVRLSQCTAEVADDGIDQDCNGTDTVTCQVDADGDGYGGSEITLASDGSCDADQHERTREEDCDDADATIHPGGAELPGNTVDEDCDGRLGACDPTTTWRNHGEFVRCVADQCERLVQAGVVTRIQCDILLGQAGKSSVGKQATR